MTGPDPHHRPSVAVLGAGVVGRTLAAGWARAGYDVVLGSREPASQRLAAAVDEVAAGTAAAVRAERPGDAVAATDLAVFTVPGGQMPDLLAGLGDVLPGRIAVDATNDVGGAALNSVAALREAGALAFRAYNTVGWEQMQRPAFGGQPSDLFFTGPDGPDQGLDRVQALITATGFRPVHLGDSDAALAAVDSVTRLWFLLAFERGYGRRLGFRLLTEADEDEAR